MKKIFLLLFFGCLLTVSTKADEVDLSGKILADNSRSLMVPIKIRNLSFSMKQHLFWILPMKLPLCKI